MRTGVEPFSAPACNQFTLTIKTKGVCMTHNEDNKLEDLFFPAMRRSVLFRAERAGGYILTSHSQGVADLGSVELNVARLCNGQNTVASVAAYIAEVEKWPETTAQEATWSALRRFQQIEALDWLMEPAVEPYFTDTLLPSDEDEALLGRALSAPLSVLWDITYACNLQCAHCLTGSGKPLPDELSAEGAFEVLRQLLGAKVFSITFCGGEPLISPHLFELIEEATTRGMDVNLDTNGLLVNTERAKKLAAAGVTSVQVSIDGREETHDRFRGKRGSFNAAVAAVRIFRSLGFNVSISSVLTAITHKDLDYLVNLAVELGATGFKTSLFLPTGRGRKNAQELMLPPDLAKEDYRKLLRLQDEYSSRLKIALEGVYPGLKNANHVPVETRDSGAGSEVGCPAGVTQLVIAANGMVYACPFLYTHPAGDLRKHSLTEIWRNANIFKIFRRMTKGQLRGRCRICPHLPEKCHGGCRAAAYALTGDIYAEDPMCWCGSGSIPV